VGIVFLRDEGADKLVIGRQEMESRDEVLCALEKLGRARGAWWNKGEMERWLRLKRN